ncbi:MAG: hypothetical protein ACJAWW_001465 [Sulfurimonas sp.]|jgi:hypothetical protein
MNKKLSIAVLSAICVTSLSAMGFQTIGYKSVSMGGAGVASSSGSVATYNNPALLAKAPYAVEVSLGGGVSLQDHGAGASYTALSDSGFIDLMDKAESLNDLTTLSTDDVGDLFDGKDIILDMNGDAIEIAAQVYFATQIQNFGIGVFGQGNAIAQAVVDQTHTRLIYSDNGSYYAELNSDGTATVSNVSDYNAYSLYKAIEDGDTYVQVKAISLVEVPLAYAYKFELGAGNLMLGSALKYMQVTAYSKQYTIDSSDEAENSVDEDKTTSNFALDIGLAYEPYFDKDLTVALVGKNLNAPDFKFANGDNYTIDPMLRVGVAYDILDSLEFAMDMDLTKNETLLDDVNSQMLGGGLNWNPASWASLRAGLMTNLDSSDEAGVIYTTGFGLGVKWFQIDLSAQYSPKTTTVDGTDYPSYAKVNLALISRW